MKKNILTILICIFAAFSISAQSMTGAQLLNIFKQGDPNDVDKLLSQKGYSLLGDSYEDEYVITWGNNVGYYSSSDGIKKNSSKPMFVLSVNFTSPNGSATMVKYRPSSLTAMRSVISYFKKLGTNK